jgi:TPR repeat protein
MRLLTIGFVCSILAFVVTLTGACAQGEERRVTVGSVSVQVPASFERVGKDMERSLRTQVEAQSAEIYKKYHGASSPAKSVDLAAFQSPDGRFVLGVVVMRVPTQMGLAAELRSQAKAKAEWGVKNGYIKRASEPEALTVGEYEGFAIEAEHTDGGLGISAGLVKREGGSQVIQLTLLSPPGKADEARAILLKAVKSVSPPKPGVSTDLKALRQDADGGNPNAQYALGLKYVNGEGMPVDINEGGTEQ